MIYYGDALSYIKETPDILSSMLENRNEIMMTPALLEMGNVGDIIIVGTGSSYNAGVMIRPCLQHIWGRRVSALYPSELEEELRISPPDALVIGISQQGTSVSVIEALDKAREAGRRTIAMTGEENTEITRHGEITVMIACGEEDAGATTKGFSATAFTLLLLVTSLVRIAGKDGSSWMEMLSQIPVTVRETLLANREMLEHLSEKMAGFAHLMIISSDMYKNLLPEVALKFSETCRKPVAGMDAETFCHGMYNAVQKHTTFLFLSDGKNERIHRLGKYYEGMGNPVFQLNMETENEEVVSLFAAMICIQYLFVLVSRKMGVNLNIPKDPEFHKLMGSKIEEEEQMLCEESKWKN